MNPAVPRWWPQRLRHQLLLLLAGITALTTVLLYTVSTARLDDAAFASRLPTCCTTKKAASNAQSAGSQV